MSRSSFSTRSWLQGGLLAGLVLASVQPSSVRVTAAEPPPADFVKFSGLSADQAAREVTAPPGFQTHMFAAEPHVLQPIAFCLDDRGRVWVAEGMTYPKRAPEGQGKDRILVLEDTDGDHKFDRRTVFMEGLNLVSGLEVGFGGVWIGAAPYLMFVPMVDGAEPKPAGPAKILLDGWDYVRDTHETLNTFTWGPDGWLYGCHGVFCPSHVGKPGTPESERQRVDAAVWRYHPTKELFEVFAEGTSNPWGVDFNERGQCIIEACVIPHLWHMIQGGRYERQGGQHYSVGREERDAHRAHIAPGAPPHVHPFIYDDIKTIADHFHYAGDKGPHAGNNRSDAAGGGHAHAGLMIYLGDSWPAEYRGRAFMNNIHGQRINSDILERRGSGYVGKHAPDFLNFNDRWSQVLNLISDQDGSVYMIDWYDKNQCHHNNTGGHDRENGRIFKVVYGNRPVSKVDLQSLPDTQLVQLQMHANEFHVRHARRVLQERGSNPAVHSALKSLLTGGATAVHRLRALWALHATRGLTEAIGLTAMEDADEYVRAWAIQLLCEDRSPSEAVLRQMRNLSRRDPSPVVRLYLASAVQRLQPAAKWPILEQLATKAQDANDHNLPLMVWFGLEPVVESDVTRALTLSSASPLPRLLEFTVRRVAAMNQPVAMGAIAEILRKAKAEPQQLEILKGLSTALRGKRDMPKPGGWEEAARVVSRSAHAEIRTLANSLSLQFGMPGAAQSLTGTLHDGAAPIAARRMALEALLATPQPTLAESLRRLLQDEPLRGAALRALARFDDPAIATTILDLLPTLTGIERRDALNTLASRATFARPLLAAVQAGRVPPREITADLLRQLRSLKQPEVEALLQQAWGIARDSSADKLKEIERYRNIYRAGGSTPGDGSRGRAVFNRVCQQCHTLFDSGGKVGPDLTGSNRGDVEYILQNMVDPNAVIPNEYRSSVIDMKDDRVLNGIVRQQDASVVTIATANEILTLPRADIKSIQQSEVSMMPEGLLAPLTDQEVRDLIYYLGRPGQVPLP